MTLEMPVKPRVSAVDMDRVVDLYTENLLRAAFGLGFPESEAEELVQDTLCAYFESSARFQGKSALLTYLFGILYNKAREKRRFQNRHDSIDAAADKNFDGHFDAEEHWNKESLARMTEVEAKAQSSALSEMLQECLAGLSAVMRMAFTMKEVEGCESEQICLVLGLTPSNLGVTLFRARNKLRECLINKGAVIA